MNAVKVEKRYQVPAMPKKATPIVKSRPPVPRAASTISAKPSVVTTLKVM